VKLDVKKILLPNLPYVFIFWFFNRVAEGYRLAEGADMVAKAMGAVSGLGALIFQKPAAQLLPTRPAAGRCRRSHDPGCGLFQGEKCQEIPPRS